MIRKAFKMKLCPKKIEEYEARHNPLWKSLGKILKDYGVQNYSIFFDEDTHLLFGYAEITSKEQWDAIAKTETCRKWWKFMADLMETNLDKSPKSNDLREVFHFD